MADNRSQGLVKGLSELLAQNGLIEPSDIPILEKDFNAQNLSFEEFLIDTEIITKSDLLEALSQYYQLPALDVVGEFFDHQFINLLPKKLLLRLAALPYRREGDIVSVVVANPDDPELLPALAQHISNDISLMVGYIQDIRDTINEFYDESITYQPDHISNQHEERSMIDVHPMGEELKVKDQPNEEIPLDWQETRDDYEKD